ncbi:hypothetical protein BN1002_00814 [Bacillus sp. B-jedd]|nr:hypothetical protein BN1002_00814 [Bacillus sp. B-jedd]
MGLLLDAVKNRRDFILFQLLKAGYPKSEKLSSLPLSELEHLYISVRCSQAKNAPLVSN